MGRAMGILDRLLWRAFGVPTGFLGRLGGRIMAGRHQRMIAARVADLLDVGPGDKVLEIGFGPGVGIESLNERLAGDGLVVGIDPSAVMLEIASTRNAGAIKNGTVILLRGTADHVPYADETFDKACAMNSYQLWPDQSAGIGELRRVLKPGGKLVLSFYGPAQQEISPGAVLAELQRAGFQEISQASDHNSVSYFIAQK